MMLDNAVEIKVPQPDSQYRLVNCKCGSDNVAYVKYLDGYGEAWAVQCFDCGRMAAKIPGCRIQHDVQVMWNKGVQYEAR